jgi:hypothetical protein
MPKQKPIPVFLSPAEIKNLIAILTQWTGQVDDHHAETALLKLTRAAKEKPDAKVV